MTASGFVAQTAGLTTHRVSDRNLKVVGRDLLLDLTDWLLTLVMSGLLFAKQNNPLSGRGVDRALQGVLARSIARLFLQSTVNSHQLSEKESNLAEAATGRNKRPTGLRLITDHAKQNIIIMRSGFQPVATG